MTGNSRICGLFGLIFRKKRESGKIWKNWRQKCTTTIEEQIVITHGTDTMTDTAKALGEKKIKKTIVITGAMIPYKFGTSDGLFNIASALAYVQTMPHGVYVAMNGRVFIYDKVIKNKGTGIFEEIV